MATFLRFHNVRHADHYDVEDDLVAAQINSLIDEGSDAAMQRADALVREAGTWRKNELLGEPDDEDVNINIEEN